MIKDEDDICGDCVNVMDDDGGVCDINISLYMLRLV